MTPFYFALHAGDLLGPEAAQGRRRPGRPRRCAQSRVGSCASSLFLVLLAIAPAAWCQAAGQDETLRRHRCHRQLRRERGRRRPIGLTALEEECPGLTARWSSPVPGAALDGCARRAGSSTISRPAVRRLLVRRSQRLVTSTPARSARFSIRCARRSRERPLTWFERFKRWLRSLARAAAATARTTGCRAGSTRRTSPDVVARRHPVRLCCR